MDRNYPGHMVTWTELAQVLRIGRCDQDEDGRFLVSGTIASFMGAGEEFIVGPDACYYVGGKHVNLAGAISGTSYSCPVTVI